MRIDRIKLMHAMIDKDMTASVLAERSGLSRGTISGIRSGRSCIYETAEKIANALDMPLEKLLEKK